MCSQTKQKGNILIVDDIPKNLQVLGSILIKEGHQVAFARAGEEALRLAASTDFELILLDVMMPGLNGFEVCRRLRSSMKNQTVPVIFLTARVEQESIIEGFKSGGQDYITKPFHAEELLARVNTQLELRYKTKELALLNASLEQKVEKRTLEIRQANAKLSKLDQAKSNFLALVSHELRTPLNALNGFSEMLVQTHLDEEQKEYLGFMRVSAERLMRFSEAAILISQLENERYTLSKQIHDVADIIQSAVVRVRADMACFPSLKILEAAHVEADFDLLENAFGHIIFNACQHNREGEKVEITINAFGSNCLIVVRDFGPGFSEEIMGTLFKKFSSDKILYHSDGLGLGLTTARMIMAAHDGDIKVENLPQSGAKVSMILPLAKCPKDL